MTNKFILPPLPPELANSELARHITEYVQYVIEQYEIYAETEAKTVCAEAYQVVGSLLSDLGQFESDIGQKILDNLHEFRMVHDDVLPWPSFEPLTVATISYKNGNKNEITKVDKNG